MAVIVGYKNFNNDNLVLILSETWRKQHKFASLLTFLLLTYYHSHFLAATSDFTSFLQQLNYATIISRQSKPFYNFASDIDNLWICVGYF